MINIINKEMEECEVMLVDINGYVHYETVLAPNAGLDIDLRELLTGIYTLIFQTTHTSFTQQIVKY
ncbi:T9SS type A sorting domain-containing protein [Polluticoccus soli]|uniref:T9SS type A sorting domain-containing protein n=1 Tax=Polluticoccus soli TaxID=3034150 RepID=UPI0023E1DA0E|nr:T9SS type A sorting domain-containing protein [Flavipsychrobacter sp. JY13-12]